MTGYSRELENLRRQTRLRDNTARESQATVSLRCGCEITDFPVTIYPGGRRVFRCREHGLQDAKKR